MCQNSIESVVFLLQLTVQNHVLLAFETWMCYSS
jgi:hypothetical protein